MSDSKNIVYLVWYDNMEPWEDGITILEELKNRNISKNGEELLEEKAINLMTKNPKTISKNTMLAEVLKIMNEKKITNIFVVENNKPIGVIHIHDLLSQGVA